MLGGLRESHGIPEVFQEDLWGFGDFTGCSNEFQGISGALQEFSMDYKGVLVSFRGVPRCFSGFQGVSEAF